MSEYSAHHECTHNCARGSVHACTTEYSNACTTALPFQFLTPRGSSGRIHGARAPCGSTAGVRVRPDAPGRSGVAAWPRRGSLRVCHAGAAAPVCLLALLSDMKIYNVTCICTTDHWNSVGCALCVSQCSTALAAVSLHSKVSLLCRKYT